jgi:hypothetical protein
VSERIGRTSEPADWRRWRDGIWLWRLGFQLPGALLYYKVKKMNSQDASQDPI